MSFTRATLIFLGSLIFSALLWTYVRLSAAYEADVDLPVRLLSPKGYALESGLPERLHARVRGAGWQILLMDFTKNGAFRFDLTERALAILTPAKGTAQEPRGSITLHSDEITLAASMPTELRVLKVEPDSLSLQFSPAAEKRVPIVSRLAVTPAQGYAIVGSDEVRPQTVRVIGARDVLDSLKAVPTETVEIGSVKESVDRIVALSDTLSNLITIPDAPKVRVRIGVQAVGERTVAGVPVVIDAVPPDREVIVIPSTASVTLRGGVERLARVEPGSVHVHIPYDAHLFDTARTLEPKVEVPQGMSFLTTEPARFRLIQRRRAVAPTSSTAGVRRTAKGGSHATP